MERRRSPWRQRLRRAGVAVGSIASVVVAQLLWFWSQVAVIAAVPQASLGSFRLYFRRDQLSYFAIVVDAAHGQIGAVEPFTETGRNVYPRGYYVLLGTLSHALGVPPITAWNLGGLIAQMVLIAVGAVVAIVITRRWWCGVFAFVPFIVGIGATWLVPQQTLAADSWDVRLSSHAVLWGPFAEFFTLNAETVALAVGACALLVLLAVVVRSRRRVVIVVATSAASAVIGLLLSVHVYGFLAVALAGAAAAAAWGLAVSRRWWLWGATVMVGVGTFWALAPALGQQQRLVALGCAVVPLLPGLVALIIRYRGLPAIPIAALLLAAAPQIVTVLQAFSIRDAFLLYREASSSDLGVGITGLLGAIPVGSLLAAVLVAGVVTRRRRWIAVPLGLAYAWAVLATNDLWGANQEPYRLWIDACAVSAIVIMPLFLEVAIWSVRGVARRLRRRPTARRTWMPAVAAGCCIVSITLVGGSLGDWWQFRTMTASQAVLDPSTVRNEALQTALRDVGDGLVYAGPCVSAEEVKALTGARVTFYNLGLAWPADVDAVQTVIDNKAQYTFDPAVATRLGVDYVVEDSACSVNWVRRHHANIAGPLASVPYAAGGSIVLWKFVP